MEHKLLEEQLGLALMALGAPNSFVRLCEDAEAALVVSKSKAVFVKGDRRNWWWESFSKKARTDYVVNDHSTTHIFDFVEPASKCWLIVDTDDDHGRFPVVETDSKHAALILDDMTFVEYYLVDREYRWLLSENHHGKLWFIDIATLESC